MARSVIVENVPQNPRKMKNRRAGAKKWYILALILILFSICVSGGLASVIEYQKYDSLYHKDLSLAQTGAQNLSTGMTLLETLQHSPFNTPAVLRAQQEFRSSLSIFTQLNHDLQSLPSFSGSLPVYGTKVQAAQRLAPLAVEASQIGIITCNALALLINRLHNPLDTQQSGLTTADLATLSQDMQQISAILNPVIEQVNSLQPSDLQLDPRLAHFVAMFHTYAPALQEWLNQAKQLLPAAHALLGIGTPANYLIEVLDSTELRPGGGFIGNYGIATFSGARLTSARITDVDLLDRPFEAEGKTIAYPSAYNWFDLAPGSWSFRDSNLDADFPTAAHYGEVTYKDEGGNQPLQGVIAITPYLIEHALAITGPISVPEYHETVTSQNLIERIHYYQLGPGKVGTDLVPSPDGHSSPRKRFTELLAEHFLARVRQLSGQQLGSFLQLMADSIHTKDLQVYFNSSVAESMLHHYQLDSTIQSPAGDSMFVVDANISPNKANSFITTTMNDQVTLDARGNAQHHLTLTYAWDIAGQDYGLTTYRDYVRVYVPPGSVLHAQQGWQPRGTGEAFGRRVWIGFFTLTYGQTITITLDWTVPGAAKQSASGWSYQYLLQRQAGIQWRQHLQIHLPSGVKITGQAGGLSSSSATSQVATLSQTLHEDTHLSIEYVVQ